MGILSVKMTRSVPPRRTNIPQLETYDPVYILHTKRILW